MNSDVQLAELGDPHEIADGGQGRVYRLPDKPGFLLKRYHGNVTVKGPELAKLIQRPSLMSRADAQFIRDTTAWPQVRVFDGAHCVGFLMREAPGHFWEVLSGRSVLRELQYLLHKPAKMWSTLRLPLPEERRTLVRDFLQLFQVLHRYDVVFGDVSMKNLLWSIEQEPRIFALDCDGFRINGRDPVVPQAQTPDWSDPAVAGGLATLDSDRYKLTLLVTRILLREPYVTPEQILASAALSKRFEPGLAARITDLIEQTTQPGSRPHPDTWIHRIDGRPTLRVGNIPGPTPQRQAATQVEVRPVLNIGRGRKDAPGTAPSSGN